jgi:uncharacterized protein
MSYKTPGVYVEEISLLPASVSGVDTAIPAFIGYTDRAENPDTGENLRMVPTRITSLLEYRQLFGGAKPVRFDFTIEDELDEEGELADRVFSASLHESADLNFKLFHSLQLYFANGGGPCYIVSVGGYDDTIAPGDDNAGLLGGIHALEKVDEPTLLVFPDAVSLGDSGDFGSVATGALDLCNKLKDRFTIIDRYISHDESSPVTDEQFRTAMGMNNLNYGAVYHPFLKTSLNYEVNESESEITHTQSDDEDGDFHEVGIGSIRDDHPSVYRSLMAKVREIYVKLPPSGAIAGVYARVDRNRGVWKAPANVSLNAVIEPVQRINDEMQAGLNVDPATGKSINVIRSFTGKGTLVWGARTLAGNDNEWRYIPVRRLFIYVEESVKKATEFVVFEPNTANTWVQVRAMIENFLVGLWRDGGLAGATPDDAFFVKVGLGETMSPQDVLEGRLIVEIGMAAVRPAEFIILRFMHKLQES